MRVTGPYPYDYSMSTDALQELDGSSRVAPRSEWISLGACSIEPNPWLGSVAKVDECKKVCSYCPVIDQCLMYALANNERHMVWGGMTPKERQAYLRSRRPNLDSVPVEFRDQYQELEGRVKPRKIPSVIPPRNPALDYQFDQSFLDLLNSTDAASL